MIGGARAGRGVRGVVPNKGCRSERCPGSRVDRLGKIAILFFDTSTLLVQYLYNNNSIVRLIFPLNL